MKNLILFIIVISLFCVSCKKEALEPDSQVEPHVDQIAEAIIGPEGGHLESGDFLLLVPEGAFDTSLTLMLYLDENDPSRLTNQVSPSYRLTGLNRAWNKPLELSLKYEGEWDEGSQIAFAFPYFNEEQEDTVQVHELYSAADSMGFLKCILPAVQDLESSLKSAMQFPPLYQGVTFFKYIMVRGLVRIGTHRSDYAEIKYDKGVDLSKVIRLGQDLDEAVLFFHALGFIDANLFTGIYKLRVEILDEENSERFPTYCKPDFETLKGLYVRSRTYFSAGVLSLYTIKVPLKHFQYAENKDVRRLAGRGIFEYGSYCRIPDKTNWIYFAFRSWVEEYFYGSNPTPLEVTPIMHPFHGMNTVDMEQYWDLFQGEYELRRHIFHGIGMSPLITFLMDEHNPDMDLMDKMYKELEKPGGSNRAIDAFLESVSVPEYTWWPEFVKAYLEGGVREIPAEMFMDHIDAGDQMHFIDKTDTVKYFDRTYPDLSARLCQVNLSRNLSESVLGEEDQLHFKLGPENRNLDYTKVLVFGYKEDQLEFLSEGSEVSIDNIKGLIESGYTTLLAAVVNSASEAPYLEETEIDLTVKIIGEKKWPWSYLAVQVVVTDAIFQSNEGVEYTWLEFQFKISDHEVEVSEDGSHFTASWLDHGNDYKYEGGMDISLDLESFSINSFYIWSKSESLSDGKVSLSEKTEIRGKEGTTIPLVYSDDVYCYHQVDKGEVCSVIGSYSYEYHMYPGESYEVKNTLISYSCLEEAEVIFYWANRPIGILAAW